MFQAHKVLQHLTKMAKCFTTYLGNYFSEDTLTVTNNLSKDIVARERVRTSLPHLFHVLL